MSLNGYMYSPVGFGAYGQDLETQVILTEQDLAPLTPGEMTEFHGISTWLSGLRGFAMGVVAGIIVGLIVEKLDHVITVKNPLADKIVSTIAVPAAASIAAMIISKAGS